MVHDLPIICRINQCIHIPYIRFYTFFFFAFPKIIYWQSALCDTKILYFNNCVSSVRPILKKQNLKITLYFTYHDLYHMVTIKESSYYLKKSSLIMMDYVSNSPTIFVNKVLLACNHTLSFYVSHLFGCFHAPMAEVTSDRDAVPIKPKRFTMWSSTEKVFLIQSRGSFFFLNS